MYIIEKGGKQKVWMMRRRGGRKPVRVIIPKIVTYTVMIPIKAPPTER
jgi:hypothetical protein